MLTYAIALFVQSSRNFEEAVQLFEKLAAHSRIHEDRSAEASAYDHLGIIAEEHRDAKNARRWYLKSLAINESESDQYGAPGLSSWD